MQRILFICHGNICRSPMAEMILKDRLKKAGREKEFLVASCAVSTEEIFGGIGNPVYPPARAELEKHGVFCENRQAVQLQKSDYSRYDRFYCMDAGNLRGAKRIFGGDPEGKLQLLLPDREVSDPWYTGRFDIAYRDIQEGCDLILRQL